MKLIDIINSPWAITSEMFAEIINIYEHHARGEKIDIEAVAAQLGRPLNNSHIGSEIIDGVAVIGIQGTIAKKMNLLSAVSGGASSQLVQMDIENALSDSSVKGIVLNIDSPGGTVDGTAELAEMIYNSRGKKPIIAYSDGMIASAAYWIASAADAIYISGDTNPIGSIGVVTTHRNISKAEEKAGVKTTEITAGKYKRIASQFGELTEEGKADIQNKIDYIYGAFVDSVAKYRGVSVDKVLSDMADGRVFIGKQAVSAGLVDGIAAMPDVIKMANNNNKLQIRNGKGQIMTIEQLHAEHADIVEAIKAEAITGMVSKADVETQVQAAVDRVCGLVSATMGAETGEKLAALAQSGITAEQVKTLNIKISEPSVVLDEQSRAEILAAINAQQSSNTVKGNVTSDERKSIAATIASGAKTYKK